MSTAKDKQDQKTATNIQYEADASSESGDYVEIPLRYLALEVEGTNEVLDTFTALPSTSPPKETQYSFQTTSSQSSNDSSLQKIAFETHKHKIVKEEYVGIVECASHRSNYNKSPPPKLTHLQLTSFDYFKNTFSEPFWLTDIPARPSDGRSKTEEISQYNIFNEAGGIQKNREEAQQFVVRESREPQMPEACEAREAKIHKNHEEPERAHKTVENGLENAKKDRAARVRRLREECKQARHIRRLPHLSEPAKNNAIRQPSQFFQVGMIIEACKTSDFDPPNNTEWDLFSYRLPSVELSAVPAKNICSSTLDDCSEGQKFVVVSVQPQKFLVLLLETNSSSEELVRRVNSKECLSVVDPRIVGAMAKVNSKEQSEEGNVGKDKKLYEGLTTVVADMGLEIPPLPDGTICCMSTLRSQNYATRARRVGRLESKGTEQLVEMLQKYMLGHRDAA